MALDDIDIVIGHDSSFFLGFVDGYVDGWIVLLTVIEVRWYLAIGIRWLLMMNCLFIDGISIKLWWCLIWI